MAREDYHINNYTNLDIPKRDSDLTVVVAIKESEDSILLAADEQITESGSLRHSMNKIKQHPQRNIAWVFARSVTIEV